MVALKTLTPHASGWHLLGAELRRLRKEAGLSQHRLATQVYVSGDLVRKVELAQRTPPAYLVESLDRLLHTGGRLNRLRHAALAATPTAAQQHAARKARAARLDRLARMLDGRRHRPRPPRTLTTRPWRLPCTRRASNLVLNPAPAPATLTVLALITIPTPRRDA